MFRMTTRGQVARWLGGLMLGFGLLFPLFGMRDGDGCETMYDYWNELQWKHGTGDPGDNYEQMGDGWDGINPDNNSGGLLGDHEHGLFISHWKHEGCF